MSQNEEETQSQTLVLLSVSPKVELTSSQYLIAPVALFRFYFSPRSPRALTVFTLSYFQPAVCPLSEILVYAIVTYQDLFVSLSCHPLSAH